MDEDYKYLDLQFILKGNELFNSAEKAVEGDPILFRRVRHARLSLDRAIVKLFMRLESQWLALGNDLSTFPIDGEVVTERLKTTWYQQADFRIINYTSLISQKQQADLEVSLFESLATRKIPELFKDVPLEKLYDYQAGKMRIFRKSMVVVEDSETETGFANLIMIH